MKNRIISLLVSLVIIGCSADTMAMDSKNSEKDEKDYICSYKLFSREWHTDQARINVEEKEHVLKQELGISPINLDPKNFYNFVRFCFISQNISPSDVQSFLNNDELMNNEEYEQEGRELYEQNSRDSHTKCCEQAEIASRIKDHMEKNCNNKTDIPPIFISIGKRRDQGYIEHRDIIVIPATDAIVIAQGSSKMLNRFVGLIPHELVHREKKHITKRNFYMLLAYEFNMEDDIDPILSEYIKAQEREADILGCIIGGPKMCRWFKESFKPITCCIKLMPESNEYFKLQPINDYEHLDEDEHHECFKIQPRDYNDHPPLEERLAYLDEVIKDMEKEDLGQQCFNPDHRTNGLPRWVDCNDCDKTTQKGISDFLKKCKNSTTTIEYIQPSSTD